MALSTQTDPSKGPCRCEHLNEPPKPQYRPCKRDSESDEVSSTSDYQCQQQTDVLKSDLPFKQYLEDEITPVVMDGFQAVLEKLPAEPIPFLMNFYSKNANKCRLNIPPHL